MRKLAKPKYDFFFYLPPLSYFIAITLWVGCAYWFFKLEFKGVFFYLVR